MNNNFKYSFNEKRYHTYNYYLKNKYNCKVAKVALDAGFTCPNRDGSKSYDACIFCSKSGSSDSLFNRNKDLLVQYEENKKIMDNKWPNKLYIPYFQAFSNTYGPLSKIKDMLKPFLEMEEVCEIAIATRPDCLNEEIINYLDSLTSKKTIFLELGLQSSNELTAIKINRCYEYQVFLDAIDRLSKTNIKICVHVINGLPFESKEDMLQTIIDIKDLPIHAIKIHMLHVLKDTRLGDLYLKEPFELISRQEYIELVVKQLRYLRPEIIIERLTGDPMKDELLSPSWITNKTTILNDIDKLMRKLDVYQGDLYE